jgi:hypothetical protein
MMASLFEYLKRTQTFLRDGNQMLVDVGDLIQNVNEARREVAMRAQCVRVLPPISAPIISADIINGGTRYTAPTVSISSPDSPGGKLLNPNGAQAVGTATQAGGVIDNIYITFGGDGYFQPVIQINDPTGTGAVIQPNLGPILQANTFQEQYNFADVDLSVFPGVESIYAVLDVSIIYATSRYSVLIYSFPQYQALIRNYSAGAYYYIPVMGSQFGRGAKGSFFLYPPPSQNLQMEWDCVCLPSDLTSDLSIEAIPAPWDDAVPYYAAHLAFLGLLNFNAAKLYKDLFDERVKRFGSYALPGRATSMYGRP